MRAVLNTFWAALVLAVTTAPCAADDLKGVALDPGYSIEIDKSDRTLLVRHGKALTRQFQIAVGRGGIGDKRIRGDNKTPLGVYHIAGFNEESEFNIFMRLNYPNVKDAFFGLRNHLIDRREFDAIVQAARRSELPPQNTTLGGAVGIHGLGQETSERVKVQRHLDWTKGCIALSNRDVQDLRRYVAVGTRVTIRE